MRSTPKIWALKHSTITNDACEVCGNRCDPVGFDPAIEGTGALVCDPCCQKHAPATWQAIEEGRRFAKSESESAAALARHDAMTERASPRPLPAPSAMARLLHAESRTIGEEAAEWTDRERTACNVVLVGDSVVRGGDDEALCAFGNLIEGAPIRITHTEAIRIVSARYRRRIEPAGDTLEDLAWSHSYGAAA